jgi:xylulokinase
MVRAVLEGVAFGLRDSLELIRAAGVEIAQVRASGGGIQSGLWRQILADILETEIVTAATNEGAAYGAAVLAAVGADWHESVETATDAWVKIGETTVPSAEDPRYTDGYRRYQALYPALSNTFHDMG